MCVGVGGWVGGRVEHRGRGGPGPLRMRARAWACPAHPHTLPPPPPPPSHPAPPPPHTHTHAWVHALQVTVLLVLNNALQGILSSFFYKFADTVLKKYSSTIAT